MSKSFHKTMMIASIVYIIVGLLLIIWPDAARQIIIYAIGAAALLYGGYRIVDFFVRKEHLDGTIQVGVALGIGCLLVGLFLIVKANVVLALLAAIIGVTIVVDSILRLQIALNLRYVGGSSWLVLLITSLVTLAFGILLLFNPFTAIKVATIVAGVSLVIDGGFTLWGLIQSESSMPKRTVTIK